VPITASPDDSGCGRTTSGFLACAAAAYRALEDNARMSQYFSVGDETIWNSPGVVDGTLFAAMAEVLADRLKVPSGLSGMIDDDCEIDVPAFEIFVGALLERDYGAGGWFWRHVVPGYILTAWTLLERAGGTVREPNYGNESHPGSREQWWARWIERVESERRGSR
jgi:hypothetical protein